MLWLKAVPWSAIISNAPLIVDGAKKLAALVRNTSAPERNGSPQQVGPTAGEPHSELAALHARVKQLEEEQRQSAELLRAMAETNAQMAQALDYLRGRVRINGRIAWLALAGVVLLGSWLLLR